MNGDKEQIFRACDACGGLGYETGKDPESGNPVQTPCTKCGETGYQVIGSISPELIEDITTTKDKVDWLKRNAPF